LTATSKPAKKKPRSKKKTSTKTTAVKAWSCDGPCIRIRGAKEHNLKSLDIDIPRDHHGLVGLGKIVARV